MATVTDPKVAYLRGLRIYELAGLAECAGPDSPESAGAKFLDAVRDDVIENLEQNPDLGADDFDDALLEIADQAPDVYTHTMWSEFIDLCAYNEDPTELGADGSDMDKCARICLYIIAERLARALIENAYEPDNA